MSKSTAPNFVAGGNIAPATFVKVSTAADNTVLQAGSSDRCIGISTPSQRDAPIANASTVAAAAGDPITIFGLGDICQLQAASGGFTHGDMLGPDANGAGQTLTSGYIGAIALESAAALAYGRVQVVSFKV